MYFKRGPILLCFISAIILGCFLELAESGDMDGGFVLFVAIVVCPIVSLIIYYACLYFSEVNKIRKQEREYELQRQIRINKLRNMSSEEKLLYSIFGEDWEKNRNNLSDEDDEDLDEDDEDYDEDEDDEDLDEVEDDADDEYDEDLDEVEDDADDEYDEDLEDNDYNK